MNKMPVDPAFSSVLSGGHNKACTVWRVHKFNLELVKSADRGKFHSGDCYLVYSEEKGKTIHYWIGKNSSIDERTTVAIKAVELDDALGGIPVQHRQKDGYETEQFLSFFGDSFSTYVGGHESGLRKFIPKQHVVKLFRVGGDRSPVLWEVPVHWRSFNHGDTFVLDSGSYIYVWRGKESGGGEALHAARLAAQLRDKPTEQIVNIIDGEEEMMTDDEKSVWEKYLPLTLKHQVQQTDNSSDKKSTSLLENVQLYRLKEDKEGIQADLVKTGNIHRSDLDPNDSFVVACVERGEVWVWLGSSSSASERAEAMLVGEKINNKVMEGTVSRLTRIKMHMEPEEFKSLFRHW